MNTSHSTSHDQSPERQRRVFGLPERQRRVHQSPERQRRVHQSPKRQRRLLEMAQRQHAARGFTLIELMVVMGIISLLVAIALPAFSAAKRAAKSTATTATISVLSTGLEQFNADSLVGGAYPPSTLCTAASPHQSGQNIQVCGANLLVWGLAGADLLGSPGFRDVNGVTPQTERPVIGGWTDDTSNSVVNNIQGLYYINQTGSNTGKPYYPRSGPYVDLSKVRLTKQVGTAFQVPSATGNSMPLASHAFLDAFDQPIVYYRANPNAPLMADDGSMNAAKAGVPGGKPTQYAMSQTTLAYVPTGVYNLLDNQPVTGNSNTAKPGMDFGAGTNHFGTNVSKRLGDPTKFPNDVTNNPRGCFVQHIGNYSVTATPQANRTDTYILLSAGPDGLFGTADDLANFPINK